ncbi:hypothetical protein ANN_20966 [Periplaneta americana]|uniref:Uncharacterized protein n=1 Tax=Periplaneta americana TaxID=6978 RepID=A0ABQ8SF72_PERAM|nr:hypothetical protein ANN_20966 [Periplaneta americana]
MSFSYSVNSVPTIGDRYRAMASLHPPGMTVQARNHLETVRNVTLTSSTCQRDYSSHVNTGIGLWSSGQWCCSRMSRDFASNYLMIESIEKIWGAIFVLQLLRQNAVW